MHRAPPYGFCALLVCSLLVLPARAQPASACGGAGRPWVSISFAGAGGSGPFERGVLQDFRAGLAADDIDVCPETAGPEHAPLARVKISASDGSNVGVSVDLSDAVTAKRVGRDLDLSVVPADGRAFAVALAADELLRASWVEVALRPARRKAPRGSAKTLPPPPQVAQAVDRSLPEPESSSLLGARVAAERYAGGETQLGADVYFRQELATRWQLELGAGMREGLTTNAPNGRVLSTALGVRTSLSFSVITARSLRLYLTLGAQASWLRFSGEAAGEAEQAELSGLVVYAQAGPAVSLRLLGPLRAELGAGGGAPLRSLEAQDGDRTVTGASGLLIYGHAGLAVEF